MGALPRSRRVAIVGALALVCSCAGSHTASAPDAELAAWVARARATVCARELRCENQLLSHTVGRCHPAAWPLYGLVDADRLLRADDLVFDTAAADRCLDELEAPCATAASLSASSCLDALVEVREPGEGCAPTSGFRADGCTEGSYCASTDGCGGTCAPAASPGESCLGRPCASTACTLVGSVLGCVGPRLGEACEVGCSEGYCRDGTCEPLPLASEGEACGGAVAECAAEHLCNAGVCIAPGSVGEGGACAATSACVAELFCGESRVCEAARPLGAPCEHGLECVDEARSCTGGVCSLAEPVDREYCLPRLGLPESVWICPAGTACLVERHVCLPIAAIGAACGTAENVCAEGARCVDGRCRAIVAPGAACGAEVVCPVAFACRAARCEPLPVPGEICDGGCFRGACRADRCTLLGAEAVCASPHECESGRCVDGRCSAAPREGEPCDRTHATCGEGLMCAVDAEGSALCVRPTCS